MSAADKTADELFSLALAHHKSGEFVPAEKCYVEVLALDPAHYPALHNLGVLAALHKQHDIAREMFTRAVAARPRDAAAHASLAGTLLQTGEFRAAITSFRRALRLRPDMQEAREGLEQAERQAAIAEDPDYASVSGQPWTDADSVWEELHGSDTLFVLFAGLGVGRTRPTFIFYNFLKRYDHVDKIFLRDTTLSWFMRGIPKVSTDVPSSVSYLRSRAAGYDKVVFMGCSAGAMAAILFGELAGADKILAFAPQTVLSEAKEQELQDVRWAPLLRELNAACSDPTYLDLRTFSPLRAAVDIYFSRELALDRAHAERITGANVRHIDCPGSSHVIALELRNSGELGRIIDAELPGHE